MEPLNDLHREVEAIRWQIQRMGALVESLAWALDKVDADEGYLIDVSDTAYSLLLLTDDLREALDNVYFASTMLAQDVKATGVK